MIGVLWIGLAAAAEPTMEELLLATDDAERGESSHSVMIMQVKTANYERSIKMESWSKGTENTLVRILEPVKDAGVATLKVGDNLWNYLPKVDRTMKVPAGMMSGSWMGSHFTNDDLVKESRLSEDFTCSFTGRPTDASTSGNYVISCVPKPDAPVVWGKVVAWVKPDKTPTKIEFWDEKGTLVRSMEYAAFTMVSGRAVPTAMTLLPLDKPGEYTKLTFEGLEFDVAHPDSLFTLQALQQ